MNWRVVLIAICLSPLSSWAESTGQCEIRGMKILTEPLQILCHEDLKIEDGAEIVTNGFPLQIMAIGNLSMGTRKGFKITSYRPGTARGNSGDIFIYGRTGMGKLSIDNRGATPADAGGAVSLELISTDKSYDQSIQVGEGSLVQMLLNGYPVALQGPIFRLPDQISH